MKTLTRHLPQFRRQMGWTLAAAATVMALASTPAVANNNHDKGGKSGLNVIGLTADQRLVSFRTGKPGKLRKIGSVTGLVSADTQLIGIDFRVQDGKLYGVGNGGGIYTIDTSNAVATMVSQLTVALNGTSFGVDFNPAANALRIVSNTSQNLRHPFAGALMFQTQADIALNYAPLVATSGVVGAAYTNNDDSVATPTAAATGTTLFDIDAVLDQVVIQAPPNSGMLNVTGKLGVDSGEAVGFDIYSSLKKGVAVSNRAFASLSVGSSSGFYRVNLLTGQATLIGNFHHPVVDIAIPLDQ